MNNGTGVLAQNAMEFQHGSQVQQPQVKWVGGQTQMGGDAQAGQMNTPGGHMYGVPMPQGVQPFFDMAQQSVPSKQHPNPTFQSQQQQTGVNQQWPQQQYAVYYPGMSQAMATAAGNLNQMGVQPVYYIAANQYFQQDSNPMAQYADQFQQAQANVAAACDPSATYGHVQKQTTQYPPAVRAASAPSLSCNVGITGVPAAGSTPMGVLKSLNVNTLNRSTETKVCSPVFLRTKPHVPLASSDEDIPTDAGVDEGRFSVVSGTLKGECDSDSSSAQHTPPAFPANRPVHLDMHGMQPSYAAMSGAWVASPNPSCNQNPASPPGYCQNPASPPSYPNSPPHQWGNNPNPNTNTPTVMIPHHQRQHHGMNAPHHHGFPNFQPQRPGWPLVHPGGQFHRNMGSPNGFGRGAFSPGSWGAVSPVAMNKKRSKRRRQSREEARRARRAPRFQIEDDVMPMPVTQLKAFHQKYKLNKQGVLNEMPRRAKFLIIKSFHEDDVHKAIKFNLWSSTPHGNEKLQKVWEEAQAEAKALSEDGSGNGPDGRSLCPLFLLFSVNKSKGFCGICEMVGPVDFERKVEWWVRRNDGRNRWRGAVPLRWIVVKDVPNTVFRDLCFPGASHRPVIFSRDATEVAYSQGCTFVNLFTGYESQSTLLQDMEFYDAEYADHLRRKAGGGSDDSDAQAVAKCEDRQSTSSPVPAVVNMTTSAPPGMSLSASPPTKAVSPPPLGPGSPKSPQ